MELPFLSLGGALHNIPTLLEILLQACVISLKKNPVGSGATPLPKYVLTSHIPTTSTPKTWPDPWHPQLILPCRGFQLLPSDPFLGIMCVIAGHFSW